MDVQREVFLRTRFGRLPPVLFPSLNAFKKPGASVSPLPLNRLHGHTVERGNVVEFQTDKKPKLHHFCLRCIQPGQFIECIVDFKHMIILRFSGGFEASQVNPVLAAAMAESPFAPGVLNEDAPHCLGRRGEEVASAVPLLVSLTSQPEPSLVHQRGRLQGLARGLPGHLGGSQTAQFLVEQRQQPLRCLRVPGVNGFKDLRHLF